jgi:quercetin dioxygenase-like cupin family protein
VTGEEHVPVYLRSHQLQGVLLKFNLASEIEALQRQLPSSAAGRAAKTLVKEGPVRVTLVALRRGADLSEHRAGGPVTIHVLSGAFRLSTASGGDTDARSGELIALDSGVPHTAHAAEDCVLLLTAAMPG